VEAERHYTRALSALAKLPDGPARVAQELALQIPLALILHVTRGFASPETTQSNARVRDLSAKLGDTQQLVMALILAYASTYTRGELRAARALAEELLDAARRAGSTFALTFGHYVAGNTRYMMGDLTAAGEHAAEALRFYREEDHRSWPSDAGTLAHAGL